VSAFYELPRHVFAELAMIPFGKTKPEGEGGGGSDNTSVTIMEPSNDMAK
jgi:hypothetical protein